MPGLQRDAGLPGSRSGAEALARWVGTANDEFWESRMRLSEIIRQAIEIGRPNGQITFDQLDDLCRGRKVEPEEIEQLMMALREADIQVDE